MDKRWKFDCMRPLIDEAFKSGNSFVFKPNGVSMLPFIKGGKDSVELIEYSGGAKKYDIVFYRRSDGQYVLHRIVKLYDDCYGVCGDNQWWIEKVYDKDIFAIVKSVNGKELFGSFIYLKTLFVRRFVKHIKVYVKRRIIKGEEK